MADKTVTKIVEMGEIFWEYRGKRYPESCRCGNACAHIEETAAKYCYGTGLDIGAGSYPFRDALPVRDLVNYFYANGKQCRRPEPLKTAINAYNLPCFVDSSMDYVFSSHCLEHLERPREAIALWIKKIKLGGILFLYLPHSDMELWRPGAPWVKNAHKWIPRFDDLAKIFCQLGLTVIAGQNKRDVFYSFFIVGKKNG